MSKKDNEEKWRIARERAQRSIEAMTDKEDAKLTAAALADPDNPPLSDRFWRNARRAENVAPEIVERYLARTRGQRGLQKAPTKQLVSLRIDRDVLAHFRATGPGWQARINEALREAAGLGARTCSGIRARTGEVCPESGVWSTGDAQSATAPISKGNRMPPHNGRSVSWTLVQAA